MNPTKPVPHPTEPLSSQANPNAFRRHCKIARLPADVREGLNLMLRDGGSYTAIIKALAQQGHHLNQSNLSRWNAGGFQDLLREQAWLEQMRARLDFASSVVNQPNTELLDQATLRIAVGRMLTLLIEFDPAVLKPKLAENPYGYVRVLNALCSLTQTALKLKRKAEETALNSSPEPEPAV